MHIVKKIPNGKVVKIDLEIVDNKINKIQIYGDFFMHPEESLIEIENALVGCKIDIDELYKTIQKIVNDNNITCIGIDPKYLAEVIGGQN